MIVRFEWDADKAASNLRKHGVSFQTALPDGFGTAQPIYAYDLHNDGSITSSRVSSYAYGFSPAYATQAATYRWVKIDDARPLYANMSVPFILDAQLISKSFQLANVTGTVTDTTVVSTQHNHYGLYDSNGGGFDPNVNGRNPYYAAPTAWSGPTDTSSKWSDNGEPIKHIADTNSGGGFLGDVNQVAAGFINDTGGNWVTSYAGQNICSSGSPVAITPAVLMNWTAKEENIVDANYSFVLNAYIPGHYYLYDGLNTWNWLATEDYTNKHAHYVITYAQPAFVQAPPALAQRIQDVAAVVFIREGKADAIAACLPQNCAYYDMAWANANQNIWIGVLTGFPPFQYYAGGLGTQVVPIIADNSIESSQPDVTYIAGAGGAGQYETIITTGLLNARLVTLPVDGQITNNPPPPFGGM